MVRRTRLVLMNTVIVTATSFAAKADGGPRGLDGQVVGLSAPRGGASAVVFCSTECPISNAYTPVLNTLSTAYSESKLRLVAVFVDPDLTSTRLAAHVRDYGLKFPVAIDRRGSVARKLGVTVTPEVVVMDDVGTVRYRGRIDDQFAARGVRNANKQTNELAEAVAAVTSSVITATLSGAPGIGIGWRTR